MRCRLSGGRRLASPLVCLCLAILSGGGARAAHGQAVLAVDRDQVNIRGDATVQSARIASLVRGEEVVELDRHNEWVQVRLPDGRAGWVHSQLVQRRLVVVGQGVRVRSAATSQSASMTMLYRGQEVGMVGQRGNWYEVRLGDGRTGWAYIRYLRAKTAADLQAQVPTVEPPPREAAPRAPLADQATATRGTGPSGAAAEPAAAAVDSAPPPAPVPELASSPADLNLTQHSPYVAGLQHEAAGEAAEALASFEQVLAAEPDNVNALFHAAKAHRQLDQLDQALVRLNHALAISGGRKDLYLTLGEVYRLRGEADSAAKYQALFRGEPPPAAAAPEETEGEQEEGAAGPGLPLAKLAGAGVLLACLIALGAWWVLRKSGSATPGERGDRSRTAARSRFDRSLERQSAVAQEGQIPPEEERELDRQIEDKWRDLRESTELFASSAAAAPGADDGEEANLNLLLDQVEALRRGLDLQEERARLYGEIVRLQNMKIEAMREELRLRGRRRP